jgi:hypothetical protein
MNSILRRLKALLLGRVRERLSAVRSAGWPGSALLQYRELAPSSPQGQLWRLSQALASAPLPGAWQALSSDWGIPEYEAKRYEGKINEGNILMSIHTQDNTQRDRAKQIFIDGGAEDIASTGEAKIW